MGRGQLVDEVREAASYLGGSRADYDTLVEMAHQAHFVLLGEATHGSHEMYRERARITQRLIAELGFNAVVVEGDWLDADRANRWTQGRSDDGDAAGSLSGFRRYPTWMWRNTVVVDFIGWLRSHNERSRNAPALFHGMDLYSLHGSMETVLRYLDRHDPEAAARTRRRYGCFEIGDEDDGRACGATRLGLCRSSEEAVLEQLLEMREGAAGSIDPELFSAEQKARLARNAEAYYRAMFGSRISTWNLRERHLAETLEAVHEQVMQRDGYARMVVWAHNSHLGDARATQMGGEGELNVGQLMREKHGEQAVLVGFTTYGGTVTAADEWGAAAQRMQVRPALPESVEALFHEVGLPRFLLPLRHAGEALGELNEPMLERAIGVVYRPRTERYSHYFEARLAQQFDAVVHIDRTRAVEPLESAQMWTAEPPETYPSAP